MDLNRIKELEEELNEAHSEAFKGIIAYYQNDLKLLDLKRECVDLVGDIFKNSFRMLNNLKNDIQNKESDK